MRIKYMCVSILLFMLLIKSLIYRLRAGIIQYTHAYCLSIKNNNEANQFIIMKNVYFLWGNFECHCYIMVKSSNGHITLTLAFRTLSLILFALYVSRSRYMMHLAVKEFICNAVISYA